MPLKPITCGIAVMGLVACGNNDSTQTLTLTGSSTVAPVASEIAKRYEDANPEIRVNVQTGGSSQGIADARSGVADIGMASRSLTEEESDLIAHTIARDGITIIVNQENSIDSLSTEEIVDIYTDEIENWQEVGGENRPITVVNKADGRATLAVFLDFLDLDNQQIEPDQIIGDNEQGIQTVAGNPTAIGYVSIGTAEFHRDDGTPISLVAINGIEPSSEAVSQGEFPISRPLNLVTKGEPTALSQDFITFAQSSQVHDTIQEQFFVPVQN